MTSSSIPITLSCKYPSETKKKGTDIEHNEQILEQN
jgi:hypothetical protein